MLWHCLACGAFYDKHLSVCTSCWRDGQVAPCFLAGRPGSGKSIWMPILLDRSPRMARKGVR